jgi:hypothetical protein
MPLALALCTPTCSETTRDDQGIRVQQENPLAWPKNSQDTSLHGLCQHVSSGQPLVDPLSFVLIPSGFPRGWSSLPTTISVHFDLSEDHICASIAPIALLQYLLCTAFTTSAATSLAKRQFDCAMTKPGHLRQILTSFMRSRGI